MGGASTQALGEISDFPDIDEDVRIKDAKQQVRDCFFASTRTGVPRSQETPTPLGSS